MIYTPYIICINNCCHDIYSVYHMYQQLLSPSCCDSDCVQRSRGRAAPIARNLQCELSPRAGSPATTTNNILMQARGDGYQCVKRTRRVSPRPHPTKIDVQTRQAIQTQLERKDRGPVTFGPVLALSKEDVTALRIPRR